MVLATEWTSDAEEFMAEIDAKCGYGSEILRREMERAGYPKDMRLSIEGDDPRCAAMRSEVAAAAERLADAEWNERGWNFAPHVHIRHVIAAMVEMRLLQVLEDVVLMMMRLH